eukprot:103007-Lingulodinium_polyedra.AAC.1
MACPAATLTPNTTARSRLSTTQKSMTLPSPARQVGSSGAQISPPIRSSQPVARSSSGEAFQSAPMAQ